MTGVFGYKPTKVLAAKPGSEVSCRFVLGVAEIDETACGTFWFAGDAGASAEMD